MAGFLQVVGIAALAKAIQDAINAAKEPQEYWVGSIAFYGPFHEFGTVFFAARPHWWPAIQSVGARWGFKTPMDQNEAISKMVEVPSGLVRAIAFDLEREVKIQIKIMGVIDTGAYRASVAADRTEEGAAGKSQRRFDKIADG